MRMRRGRSTLSFLERIAEHSKKVRAKVASLPPGEERDAMLLKMKQAERAARISHWLSSGEEATEPPTSICFTRSHRPILVHLPRRSPRPSRDPLPRNGGYSCATTMNSISVG